MHFGSESTEFRFGGFSVFSDRQSVYKGQKKLSVGTKIYYLLVLLVENHGTVLSKDEIIEAVWPGQVVTNAALSKQILRLRQLLEDNDPENPIIETHRGAGYRFTLPVEVISAAPVSVAAQHKQTHSQSAQYTAANSVGPMQLVYAAAVLCALVIGAYLVNRNTIESSGTIASKLVPQQTISMALVPSKNNANWLSRGGLGYFSDLLNQHEGIHTISPEPEWYSTESPERLAIALTTYKNVNYSCLIDIRETAKGFELEATLRTDSEVIAKTQLSAVNLPQLFEQADKWISVHLSVREKLSEWEYGAGQLTQDNYALQSYLQGIFEIEVSDDAQKAADYFRAAVNKDQSFLLAWIRLAESYLALSKFDKVISIVDTHLIQTGVEQGSLASIRLHFIKAIAYAQLGDVDKALVSIQSSVDTLGVTDDPYLKLEGLKSLSLLASLQENWTLAEKYLLERLALTQKNLPLPNQLGRLHLELARIYYEQRESDKLRREVNQAIGYFEKTNNANGLVRAFMELNRQNYLLGRYDQGVHVIRRAEPYIQHANPSFHLMMYYNFSSFILNLRGYFDLADSYRQKMRLVAEQTNSRYYLAVSEFITAHQFYVQGEFSKAKDHIESTLVTRGKIKDNNSSDKFMSVVNILITARASTPEDALAYIDRQILLYPDLEVKYKQELNRARGHILIKQGLVSEGIHMLEEVVQAYREIKQVGVANYVGFEILEVLVGHPELPYRDTLNRLEANTSYDYLFFKLKSQFLAREHEYLAASMLMQENKLRANQLWKPEDQLLLEEFQNASL